jgi:hypothetical protein
VFLRAYLKNIKKDAETEKSFLDLKYFQVIGLEFRQFKNQAYLQNYNSMIL